MVFRNPFVNGSSYSGAPGTPGDPGAPGEGGALSVNEQTPDEDGNISLAIASIPELAATLSGKQIKLRYVAQNPQVEEANTQGQVSFVEGVLSLNHIDLSGNQIDAAPLQGVEILLTNDQYQDHYRFVCSDGEVAGTDESTRVRYTTVVDLGGSFTWPGAEDIEFTVTIKELPSGNLLKVDLDYDDSGGTPSAISLHDFANRERYLGAYYFTNAGLSGSGSANYSAGILSINASDSAARPRSECLVDTDVELSFYSRTDDKFRRFICSGGANVGNAIVFDTTVDAGGTLPVDGVDYAIVDAEFRILNVTGVPSFENPADDNLYALRASSGSPVWEQATDLSGRQLFDSAPALALDWGTRALTSSAGVTLIDWTNARNSDAFLSWQDGRTLINGASDDEVSAAQLIGDLYLQGAGRLKFDGDMGPSYVQKGTFGDYQGVSLMCAAAYELNWQNSHLSNRNSSTLAPIILDSSLQFNGALLLDNTGVASHKINDRQLCNAAGDQTVDHDQLILYDGDAATSISWGLRQLSDQDEATALSWDSTGVAVTKGIGLWGATPLVTQPTLTLYTDPSSSIGALYDQTATQDAITALYNKIEQLEQLLLSYGMAVPE